MYQDDINEYGCPLRDQTGSVGVQNFDLIIGLLAPELRAAFEAERAARQTELDLFLAANVSAERDIADASAELDPDPIGDRAPLLGKLEHWLGKHGRLGLRELIEGLRPRAVAH
jgi:hypothetical protein